MNKIILYLIFRLNPIWKSLGADTNQLNLILDTKLTMDDRRPVSIRIARQQKKETNNSSWGTILISLFFGIFMMMMLTSMSTNLLTGFTLYFVLFITMLAMTLISDFTSVLIDVRDNYIVLPRPVNDRTVLLSRLLHITIHLSKLVIPMALPAIIYIVITHGIPGAALLILLVMLATILTIFLINLVYIFILKITTPSRFKEIINYVQIAFTIFIFAFYELFPRLMADQAINHIKISTHFWIFFTPPFWLASAWDVLINHHWQTSLIISASLAIVVPFLSIWIVIRFLAPSFNQKLSSINSTTDESNKSNEQKIEINKTALSKKLANLFIKNKIEKTGFIFGWKMTSRSRDFKLKVYPVFGYLIVLFILFLFIGHDTLKDKTAFYKKGPGLIIILYMCSLMISNALILIRFSEKFRAAWIYYIAPMEKPGKLIRGVLKMILIKYFVPIYLIIAILALFFRGASFIPNLILGCVNVILISIVLAMIYVKSFPFSREWSVDQASGRIMQAFLLMIIIGVLGVLHYFVMNNNIVIIIFTVLVIIADWLLLDYFGNKTWEQIGG